MESKNMFVTIIVPALNEENNIALTIRNTLSAFKAFDVKGEILVINNGSTDRTELIVRNEIKNNTYGIIKLFSYDKPIGLGGSFWVGVDKAEGDIVCMIPGDNENRAVEVLRYLHLFPHTDMVIPYIYNRAVRTKFRNTVSDIYRFIINKTFGLSLFYTNGTVMYKKEILKKLQNNNKDFFFQTDILARLIKKGCSYTQVPNRLWVRNDGKSKAISFNALWGVIKGYLKLKFDICFKNREEL